MREVFVGVPALGPTQFEGTIEQSDGGFSVSAKISSRLAATGTAATFVVADRDAAVDWMNEKARLYGFDGARPA